MNFHRNSLSILVLLLASAGSAFAQSCPNWSSKFDQVTNQEVLAKLRTTDWDLGIEQAGGPEAAIAVFRTTLKDAQQRKQNAARAADLTKASSAPESDATWAECKNAGGAHMAAKCEYLNMSELILTLEGSIEIVECRER